MPSKLRDNITYPFWNLNGASVKIWDWFSNLILQFITGVIVYPCLELIHASKKGPPTSL